MYLQIREIVLWPRNPNFEPRRLQFELGKVNVVSGASRTGKSAVIPIIDYCLGAGTCSIPVKTIRKYCEWFGIIVVTAQGDKLLARREPGTQRSTDDMYLLEAERIAEIPRRIAKNTSADAVKRLLDELAGLSRLDFSGGDESTGFEGRPSFRDLAAFTFQPQNVVANPDVLFFKANTYEHREKLRKIFPYVLGAVTPTLMAKQFELGRVRQELRRKERELRDAQEVSARWSADLKAKFSEAQELGLFPKPEQEVSRGQMIEKLEEVVARTDLTLSVSTSTITDALHELSGLEVEEREVSRGLTTLRHRLSEMNRMRIGVDQYQDALAVQRGRLQLSSWLASHTDNVANCPMCGSHTDSAKRKLAVLAERLQEVESEAGIDKEVPAAFDRELQRVTAEVGQAAERLRSVQIRKRALSSRSNEAHQQQFSAQRVERFVGNLESALDLHRRLAADSELVEEVARLRKLLQRLEAELREQDVEARKRRALHAISNIAGRLLPNLDVESPNDPISLEINDLTIKVRGMERDDYLSEIGSGSNWLSYHLAVLLALHQFFLSQNRSPVPAFLVFDQPSQVYFPKRVVARSDDQEDEEIEEAQLRDEDVVAVRRAFEVMGRVALEAQGSLQLIVLDHASLDVWGDIAGVVGLPEWRNGVKLVPMAWLDDV
jgi:flagellar biosynthesis chaperone FliJ